MVHTRFVHRSLTNLVHFSCTSNLVWCTCGYNVGSCIRRDFNITTTLELLECLEGRRQVELPDRQGLETMGRTRGRAANSKEKCEDGAEVVREARGITEAKCNPPTYVRVLVQRPTCCPSFSGAYPLAPRTRKGHRQHIGGGDATKRRRNCEPHLNRSANMKKCK